MSHLYVMNVMMNKQIESNNQESIHLNVNALEQKRKSMCTLSRRISCKQREGLKMRPSLKSKNNVKK